MRLSNKKKNSDFFDKLDKDLSKKNCEYAVLVSMPEEESELYTGITDVSYEYPKMFVVRPQFFLAIIALLRNAAQETKAELEQMRQQNIDITNSSGGPHLLSKSFSGPLSTLGASRATALRPIAERPLVSR